jgi:hypothetical protein
MPAWPGSFERGWAMAPMGNAKPILGMRWPPWEIPIQFGKSDGDYEKAATLYIGERSHRSLKTAGNSSFFSPQASFYM